MQELLTDEEVRVLGCLVEKALSTPDYYPMTVNALTTACNQKTSRDPVVEYDEADVGAALEALQRRRLVGTAGGAYSRSVKYRHALAEAWALDEPASALLASLMLRGPQTPGELRSRTTRMHDFEDLEAVQGVLEALAERDTPLVTLLPLEPGRKEARYAHLLAGEPDLEAAPEVPSRNDRVGRLEGELASLKRQLHALQTAFETFRKQFE